MIILQKGCQGHRLSGFIRLEVKAQYWVGLKELKAGLIPHLSAPCSMTSPSANQKVSLGLMMSCESNRRRLLAPLQWATEGTQRVILSSAAQQQLCPCLLHLLISILTRPLNCLSALMENDLSDTDEPSGCTAVSLCWQIRSDIGSEWGVKWTKH